MTESPAIPPVRIATLAAIEARPWGPLWLGVASAATLMAGMLLWWAAFGLWGTLFDPGQPFGISLDARSHLSMCVLLPFIGIGTRWVRRRSHAEMERLLPISSISRPEFDALCREAFSFTSTSRVACLVGAAAAGGAVIPLSGVSVFDAHLVWAVVSNTVVFYWMLMAARMTFRGWGVLDQLSRSIARIDLMDPTELAPIGRYGLGGAFLWLVGSSIASVQAFGLATLWPIVLLLSLTLLLGTVSLLRPTLIARERLRAAKAKELDRVRARIDDVREQALSTDQDRAVFAAPLLPGLLAYEARIADVREWPFDTPTLLRFGILAAIAMGSWLGGALVERLLGEVLG